MNDKTRIIYRLSKMYEYISDALQICQENDNDYERVTENMITKHAINMCIVQMGEQAAGIRDIDTDFYYGSNLDLPQIKGIRNRITHSYGDIDYSIIKNVLKNNLPELIHKLEEMIHPSILKNPYILYEQEYDEYIKNL